MHARGNCIPFRINRLRQPIENKGNLILALFGPIRYNGCMMKTKSKDAFSDLQFFLDSDSRIIASDSQEKKKLKMCFVSDTMGAKWSVWFLVLSDKLTLGKSVQQFDNLIDAVELYESL